MGVTYLDPAGCQMGNKESIEDTARVLGRMFDGIEYRGFGQDIVRDPNEATPAFRVEQPPDECHPTQIIADLLTIQRELRIVQGAQTRVHGRR